MPLAIIWWNVRQMEYIMTYIHDMIDKEYTLEEKYSDISVLDFI